MRSYPETDTDLKEIGELNVEQWQIDCLKANPNYVYWGNFEDYMCSDDAGWRSRGNLERFSEMWELDDYNEVVNFYFEVHRKSKDCVACGCSGLNPETKKIKDDWYDFAGTGRKWNSKITEDEVEALVKAGRLRDLLEKPVYYSTDKKKWMGWKDNKKVEVEAPKMPTVDKVNSWNKSGMGHDGINCWICVKTRAKRLGVYGECEKCGRNGYIYTEPKGKLALQLWVLHPRKGCSKGVYINEIKQDELKEVFAFLNEAKARNDRRFSKLTLLTNPQ